MSSSRAIDSDQEPQSKKPTRREPTSNLQLPDDLVLCCLARVPRLHHPILSLVSKTFRSLTSSPDLHRTRSLLNLADNRCLYVCLQFPTESTIRWFTLCRKPDKTLTDHQSGYALAPVRINNAPPVEEWSYLVDVGHRLYALSKEDYVSSCKVFFLDCRTHTWVGTPGLRLAHTTNPKFDGRLYLAGSCEKSGPDSLNCVEVFDAETQTWRPVPEEKRVFRAGDFQGKAYKSVVLASCGKRVPLVAKVKDSTNDLGGCAPICLIEKTFYWYQPSGEFVWSNGASGWKTVQGLEGLPKFPSYSVVTFVNFGGKIVVFWDEYVSARGGGCEEKMIWCAEISLEIRCGGEEVWGTVEWFDALLTVPKSCRFVFACSATV